MDAKTNLKISSATSNGTPLVLIYGAEGNGKTTLAAKFPKPVALLLERGLPRGVTIDAIDGITSFAGVMDVLRELYRDPHGYQTLVIDTVDTLEPMLLEHVCDTHHWKNIEHPPYGKGWVIADAEWMRFITAIRALRDKHHMTIVLVAHSAVERVDDPRAPSYTAYLPKLHKRARHLILDASDVVGFLAEDLRIAIDGSGFRERSRATSSNQRFLFVEGCPAFVAKNRYGMPPKIPVPIDFQFGELSNYWQGESQ
jgi:AAA domain